LGGTQKMEWANKFLFSVVVIDKYATEKEDLEPWLIDGG